MRRRSNGKTSSDTSHLSLYFMLQDRRPLSLPHPCLPLECIFFFTHVSIVFSSTPCMCTHEMSVSHSMWSALVMRKNSARTCRCVMREICDHTSRHVTIECKKSSHFTPLTCTLGLLRRACIPECTALSQTHEPKLGQVGPVQDRAHDGVAALDWSAHDYLMLSCLACSGMP